MKKIITIIIVLIYLLFVPIQNIYAVELNVPKEQNEISEYTRSYAERFLTDLFRGKEIFDTHTSTPEEVKTQNNIFVLSMSILLLAYWGFLLWRYDKEDKQDGYYYVEDKEMFNKYNPLLAGCFVQERNVCSRDLIAVILNLVNKGIVNLEVVQDAESKSGYKYMLSRNRDEEQKMDEVERYVHSMFFNVLYDRDGKVDLAQKLEEIPEDKEIYKKLKQLNKVAKTELNKKGANINYVPKALKAVNFVILFFVIFIIMFHVYTNGLSFTMYQSTFIILILILMALIFVIPLVALIIQLIISTFFLRQTIFKRKN